jgi:hypothetical protein
MVTEKNKDMKNSLRLFGVFLIMISIGLLVAFLADYLFDFQCYKSTIFSSSLVFFLYLIARKN